MLSLRQLEGQPEESGLLYYYLQTVRLEISEAGGELP